LEEMGKLGFNYVKDALILAVNNNDAVKMVADVIIKQIKEGKERILVSIPGSGGSGKSTFAYHLQLALNAQRITTYQLSSDDYLYDRTFCYAPRDLEEREEMQGAAMYNWQRIIADMQAFKEGESFYAPKQDKDSIREVKIMDWYHEEVNPQVLIFEGCLADHGAALQDLIDITVGITCPDLNRLSRKVARDVEGRGQSEGWIIYDFASKQFHERTDIIKNDLKTNADFIWDYDEVRKRGRLYIINSGYNFLLPQYQGNQPRADLRRSKIEIEVLV